MVGAGPDKSGAWHPKVLASLAYAGDWLRVNGEAIYATRPCKIPHVGHIYFTRNKNHNILYAISEGWPGERIKIKNVKVSDGSTIKLLGYEKPLHWIPTGNDLVIILPRGLQKEENRPCRQAYTFKMYGTQRN